MSLRHLALAAAAVAALAACADRTPTAVRPEASAPPRLALTDGACTGTFRSEFSPALTATDDTISVFNEYNYNCTLGASSGSGFQAYVNPYLSCVEVLGAAPPKDEVIRWTGGSGPDSSVVHYSAVVAVGPAALFAGAVLDGRFAGDAAQLLLAPAFLQGSNPLACPTGLGTVSRVSGTLTLTITDTSP